MLHTIIHDIMLGGVALFAGFMDTLAGGGGLITIPFLLFTGMPPLTALGTNKMQAAIAESTASWHFFRKQDIKYNILKIGVMYTFIGSATGTILIQFIPVTHLERLIPFLLLSVLVYFLIYTFIIAERHKRANTAIINSDPTKNTLHPSNPHTSPPEQVPTKQTNLKDQDLVPHHHKFAFLGICIGFYNGFFGPGTGSIWSISLMQAFKIPLQRAIMYTKPLNLTGNFTALFIFLMAGHIDWLAAIIMGIGAFMGGKIGAHFVMYRNTRWINVAFMLIMLLSVSLSFIKTYG